MNESGPETPGFISDANVLIDYAESDPSILRLVAQHLATISTASVVLDEVEQLSPEKAVELGLQVIEPSLALLFEASRCTGRTSLQDRLCMLLAKENNLTCLTNDRCLRSECREAGIACAWGLEPMRWLVAREILTPRKAISVARKIAATNPFITQDIVKRFQKQIGL